MGVIHNKTKLIPLYPRYDLTYTLHRANCARGYLPEGLQGPPLHIRCREEELSPMISPEFEGIIPVLIKITFQIWRQRVTNSFVSLNPMGLQLYARLHPLQLH